MKKIFYIPLILLTALTSCKNAEWDFPDFGMQSVYFAYQGPIRTVTLGEDIFDTSLDNEHKIRIMATTGGVYSNEKDISIGFVVDNAKAANLSFPATVGGGQVKVMPSSYYTLASNNIVIPKGSLVGGVEVQLTDAFFADPLSTKTTYVIPLKMTGVNQADSILAGKDYTLYAVKYVNPWHGTYLRRGKDVFVGKGGNTALNRTETRHMQFVEKDQLQGMTTRSLTQAEFPLVVKGTGGVNVNRTLLLTFDASGNCTVSSADGTFAASGTGKFVKKGEKNSWGNKDRDALYLNYQVELSDVNVTTTDTLVLRDRGVRMETFTPVAN
ncbi:DUF5627 domain-containing protein [Paradesertivirga mongoliensis]|uniref:DUF5627 domain-containing protein n=1 Tax=Paradesertivirga mongoliensis TaxID=2100740 RepID=A0ABW4ZLB7_9SPHI|nr:DUF5627 domain-containing protein [Pedobacter mongoliensis]